MAYIPKNDSVVAFQSDPTKLVGTVSVVGTLPVTLSGNPSISGQVGASVVGHAPVVIVGGSILTSSTANQSVSGTVDVGNFPAVQVVAPNNSSLVSFQLAGSVLATTAVAPANQSVSGTVLVNNGSVVAFQGTPQWTVKSSLAGGIFPVSGSVAAVVTNNVTVVSSIAGGIFPISGSVAAVVTNFPAVQAVTNAGSIITVNKGSVITVPPQGTSVSGTVLVNNGSVVAFQGTPEWTVKSSLAGGIFPISGSVAVGNFPAVQVVAPNNSSMFAFQKAGSVLATTAVAPANQSVSGTVGASTIGTVPVTQAGTWISSVFGNVSVLGTVPVTQATDEWTVKSSLAGGIFPVSGSVAAVVTNTVAVSPNNSSMFAFQKAGSVLATTAVAPANQSVSGTVLVNNGSVVAFQGTPQWTVKSSIAGGVFPISGSVAAVVTNFPTTQNISGSVAAWLQSTNASVITVGTAAANQSVSGTVHIDNFSSVIAHQLAGSIITVGGTVTANAGVVPGSVVAFQGTPEWTVKSSLAGGIFPISGSVAAVVTNFPAVQVVSPNNSSMFSLQKAGSLLAVSGTVTANAGVVPGSVAAHIKSGSVIAVLGGNTSVVAIQSGTQAPSVYGVRNDAVASFLGANLTARPIAVDSAGRTLTKPYSASESQVEGTASHTSTSVAVLIAGAGVGLRNHITDILLSNTGATTTLVTFSDATNSILGYSIAPTGGGSNIRLATPIRTAANSAFRWQPATATSTLYATIRGYKAP